MPAGMFPLDALRRRAQSQAATAQVSSGGKLDENDELALRGISFATKVDMCDFTRCNNEWSGRNKHCM
jgi:hypothetical protein